MVPCLQTLQLAEINVYRVLEKKPGDYYVIFKYESPKALIGTFSGDETYMGDGLFANAAAFSFLSKQQNGFA